MDLKVLEDIKKITDKYNAQLLPVIKDKKIEDIRKVYDLDFREFGENRIEELITHKKIIKEGKFHFIAPLQSRKIKEILNNCVSIHTVSRKKEAEIINENYSNQKVYIQINIDDDPNKNGIKTQDVNSFLSLFQDFKYFPAGLMCIPSLDSDSKVAFSNMQKINQNIMKNYKDYNGELSMGMSDDYEIALDYGATIIRIGSKIFR